MEATDLAEVLRGSIVESKHLGVIAVVTEDGQLVAQAGDPSLVTYIRSAAKPMQAVPVVASGAAAYFGFSEAELAVLTSSHSGEEEHISLVAGILDKLGLSAAELQCGIHLPLHADSARRLLARGLLPTVLHNTCSGKHAGMLALAQYHGWPREGYHRPEHPVQQAMLAVIAQFTDLRPEEIPLGVDGCGVPVFAMSVRSMALAYARLARPTAFPARQQEACRLLNKAMTSYPGIVAGTDRLATELMKVGGDRFIAKDGAEGIFCLAVPAKGWGLAVKVLDGSSRALGPVVISALAQLGLLDSREQGELAGQSQVMLKNNRDEEIGRVRAAFTLD